MAININYSKWETDPQVAIQISKELEKTILEPSKWANFFGKGSNRGIRIYETRTCAPYRPIIQMRSTGDGVRGDTRMDANIDSINYSGQTIYPTLLANSYLTSPKDYSATSIPREIEDRVLEAKIWMQEKIDKSIFANLAHNPTDAVIASKEGYMDTSKYTSVIEAARKITAESQMNLKTIRRAIVKARTGERFVKNTNTTYNAVIKPAFVSSYNEKVPVRMNNYIICLSSYACEQLRNDSAWIELQKNHYRGDNNNLFTGLMGYVDGCPVIDMGIHTSTTAGIISSSIGDSEFEKLVSKADYSSFVYPSKFNEKVEVDFGFLLGASAVAMASSCAPKVWFSKDDHDRRIAVNIQKVFACAKMQYTGLEDNYEHLNGVDYGTIALLSARV